MRRIIWWALLLLGCTQKPADPSIKYTLAEYLAAMRPVQTPK